MTTAAQRRVPQVSVVASVLLALAGLGISIYLTIEHYDTSLTLACPETGRINCQRVTTSQYSHLLGIPVAVLGVLFFTVALALLLPEAWRSTSGPLPWMRLGWTGIGVAMVLYLVWAEFFGANAICLWCTSVHVITFALFAVVALSEAWIGPPGAAVPAN